jgi:hypothetical protein
MAPRVLPLFIDRGIISPVRSALPPSSLFPHARFICTTLMSPVVGSSPRHVPQSANARYRSWLAPPTTSADHPGLTFDECVIWIHPEQKTIAAEIASGIVHARFGERLLI